MAEKKDGTSQTTTAGEEWNRHLFINGCSDEIDYVQLKPDSILKVMTKCIHVHTVTLISYEIYRFISKIKKTE